jgi:hypothetical protein
MFIRVRGNGINYFPSVMELSPQEAAYTHLYHCIWQDSKRRRTNKCISIYVLVYTVEGMPMKVNGRLLMRMSHGIRGSAMMMKDHAMILKSIRMGENHFSYGVGNT